MPPITLPSSSCSEAIKNSELAASGKKPLLGSTLRILKRRGRGLLWPVPKVPTNKTLKSINMVLPCATEGLMLANSTMLLGLVKVRVKRLVFARIV